jgi:hypothetical protein
MFRHCIIPDVIKKTDIRILIPAVISISSERNGGFCAAGTVRHVSADKNADELVQKNGFTQESCRKIVAGRGVPQFLIIPSTHSRKTQITDLADNRDRKGHAEECVSKEHRFSSQTLTQCPNVIQRQGFSAHILFIIDLYTTL